MSLNSNIISVGHAINGLLHRCGYHVAQFPMHRGDSLVRLIREKQFRNYVEVGIWKGDSSKKVLSHTELEKAWLVDPYTLIHTGGMSEKDINRMYESVRSYFARKHPQAEMLRETSEEAVKRFDDESLDMVFVDGEHSYEG